MSLGAGSVGLFCACVVWEERTEMQQEKGFIWLTVPEGSSPSWSGGCGSNQQGMSGKSRRLAYLSKVLLKVPGPSQMGSVVWDQVFEHMTLWGDILHSNYSVEEG